MTDGQRDRQTADGSQQCLLPISVAAWRRGWRRSAHERRYLTSGPVSTWMGDRLRARAFASPSLKRTVSALTIRPNIILTGGNYQISGPTAGGEREREFIYQVHIHINYYNGRLPVKALAHRSWPPITENIIHIY